MKLVLLKRKKFSILLTIHHLQLSNEVDLVRIFLLQTKIENGQPTANIRFVSRR